MNVVPETEKVVTGKVVFARVPGHGPEHGGRDARRTRMLHDCGMEKLETPASPFPVVNLMARETLDYVTREFGISVWPGFCGEDVCTEDLDYDALEVGSLLTVGDALLLVFRKEKNCGGKCGVSKVTLDCPLSKSWMSAWLVRGGGIRIGDSVSVVSVERMLQREAVEVES